MRVGLLALCAVACASGGGEPAQRAPIDSAAGSFDGADGAGADGDGGLDGGVDGADGAAGDDGDGGGADGGDGGDGGGCSLGVGRTHPGDGSGGGHYRSTVSFWLSSDPGDVAIGLVSAAGDPVDGALSVHPTEGGRVRVDFAPISPLKPLTVYTAVLTGCGDRHEVTFQMDTLGTALTCSPADATYVLDLSGGRWMEPDGDLPGLPFDLSSVALHLQAPGASELDLVGARLTTTGDQDTCAPTNPFDRATWAAPHFAHGPRDALLPLLADGTLTVSQVVLSGDVRPDCAAIDGVRLSGVLDAREVASALPAWASEGVAGVCARAATVGAPCVACEDGAVACIPFRVEDVRGVRSGADLTCIDQVTCHPACDRNTCEAPTDGLCE